MSDARPVESSGSDVAAANTVAPNSTPVIPTWSAMASPLASSKTPQTSVARAERVKTIAAAAVLVRLPALPASFFALLCPRGSFCDSGAEPASCQGSDFAARPTSQTPRTQNAAISTPPGARRAMETPAGRRLAMMARINRATTSTPSRTSDRLAAL